MPKFRMPMSKSKDILPDSNSWWKDNFDIEVKGQGHKDVTHCTMVIHSRAKQSMTMLKDKKLSPEHKAMS